MKKKQIITAVLFLSLLLRRAEVLSQVLDTTFTLTVNASAQTYPLEPVFGLGVLASGPWEIENTDSLQLVGIKNNFWRLGTISFDRWFQDTTALPTLQDWANFDDEATQYAQRIYALKVKYPDVTFGAEIDGMPRWLSSCPTNEGHLPQFTWNNPCWRLCAPSDTAAYSLLIQRVVNIFTQQGLGDFYYGVWNEPENMFYGTQAEYLELYKIISTAVKQANPLAKVGGTSDVTFYARKWEYNKNDTFIDYGAISRSPDTMMKKFIQFVAQENLPLDFIDWHFPTTDPKGSGLENQVQQLKDWLNSNGLNVNTPVRIGEWIVSQCDEATAGELSSAYIVSMLKEMARLGIPFHNHTSWTDQSGWADSCWADVGLFSGMPKNHPEGVVRAKFNAFRMVSRLQNQRMNISEIDDYFADAVVTSDSSKEKISIILANYVVPGAFLRIVRNELLQQGILDTAQMEQLKSCLIQQMAINGGNSSAALNYCVSTLFSPSTQAQIQQAAIDVQSGIAMRDSTPVTINLFVTGLGDTLYEVKMYAVDWYNANECRYNKRTEPVPSTVECGTGGAVDQLATQVESAADSAFWHELLVNMNWTTADTTLLVWLTDTCGNTPSPSVCVQAWALANPDSFSKNDTIIYQDWLAANQIKDNVYSAGEKMAVAYLNGLPDVGLFPVSITNIPPDSTGKISLNVNLIPNGVALVELTSLGGYGYVSVMDNLTTNEDNMLLVYPNPSTGKFIIEMKNKKGQMENGVIEIYNVFGEKVFQSEISNPKSKIDLSVQPNGIYFYQVKNNKQFISSGKIIIQK